MRRIHVVLAALAILVTSFAAFSGPAMAQDDLNSRDARGYLIRCDGDLYAPYNVYSYNDYYYSPFYNDYSYEDYEDYWDELDNYLDDLEDSSWGWNYYNW